MSTVGVFRRILIKCRVFNHCTDYCQVCQGSSNIPKPIENTRKTGFWGFAGDSSQTVVTIWQMRLSSLNFSFTQPPKHPHRNVLHPSWFAQAAIPEIIRKARVYSSNSQRTRTADLFTLRCTIFPWNMSVFLRKNVLLSAKIPRCRSLL